MHFRTLNLQSVLRALVTSIVILTGMGCAQVPKESVELSATVGRDVSALYESHKAVARLLFARMRGDANRFIDRVYAPYQIRAALEADYTRGNSQAADDRATSLFLAVNNAFKPGAGAKLQQSVLDGMSFMVGAIRDDIESKRKDLLKPLDEQEAAVLSAIDKSYQQVIYANSVVTAHLASVVKVQDAQSEVLKAAGLDPNLPATVSKKLAETSDKVAGLVQQAEVADKKADTVAQALAKLKQFVSGQ